MQCNLCRSTLRGNKFSETIDLGIRFSEKEPSYSPFKTFTGSITVNMTTQSPTPLDGNQNRTGEILGACIGFLVVSFISVVLRLYTRVFLIKSARWDDWTIVLALVLSSPCRLETYMLT